MKHLLATTYLLLASSFAFSQSTNDNLSTRQLLRLSSTYVGMEWLTNSPATTNGFKVTQNLYGPSIELMGTMSFGYLTGMAYHQDSAAFSRARLMYYDVHYAAPLLKTRVFNLRPELGFRFVSNQLNSYFTDSEWDANGIGAGLYVGFNVNVGPVNAKVKYGGDAAFNLGNNSFKSATSYGSFTIGISPMMLFMNPKNFTSSGIVRNIENYKKTWNGRNYEFKKNPDGTETRTTIDYYKESWTESYGVQDFRCRDVQPFLFVGPRAITNINLYPGDKKIASWGLNLGFRAGSLWMNGFYEKGDLPYKEPYKRNTDFQNKHNNMRPRIDGAFANSTRYGLQAGLELVTFLQKKDFIYVDSKTALATSHFSIIPYAGYVVAQAGDLFFYDAANGVANQKAYVLGNPGNENDIYTTGKDLAGLNLGIQVGIGAAAMNLERSYYKSNDVKQPLMGKWQFGFSYNIPIVRVFRAITSKAKFKAAWEDAKKVKATDIP
jgi:hypothetical protein